MSANLARRDDEGHPGVAALTAPTSCDVCGRTLLRGEHAHPYLDGTAHREVCELCTSRAIRRGGYAREACPRTRAADSASDRRRLAARPAAPAARDDGGPAPDVARRRGGGRRSALERRRRRPSSRIREPRHVRAIPSSAEHKVSVAIDAFNASEHPRTLAGIARSLGLPVVSVRPVADRPEPGQHRRRVGAHAGTGTRSTSPRATAPRARRRPGRRVERAGRGRSSRKTSSATSGACSHWGPEDAGVGVDEGSMAAVGRRSLASTDRDLLRSSRGAGGRAVRQAHRLLRRRPSRDGDRRPTARVAARSRVGRRRRPRASRPPALADPRRASAAGRRLSGRRRGHPESLKLVLHVDGGARGNPGPAAIGVVVSEPGGEVIDELAERIGVATNNVAEYRAVLRALERARELQASEVEIIGDSELVARQLAGAYKVKHPALKPLYAAGAVPRCAGSMRGASAAFPAPRTPKPTRSSTRRSTPPDSRVECGGYGRLGV